MDKKDKISLYLLATAFLLVGVMLSLDLLEVAVWGIRGCWVGILLVLVAIALFVGGIIAKSKEFIALPIVCLVVGALLILIAQTTLTIANLWPMIPLSITLGILVASLLRARKRVWLELGIWGTLICITCLVGSLFSLWIIVFPLMLVLTGVVIIMRTAFTKTQPKYEIPSVSIVERAEKLKKEKEETK